MRRIGDRLVHEGHEVHIHHEEDFALLVLGDPPMAIDGGLIVGPIFDRRHPGPVGTLAPEDQAKIRASQGRHLTETFWGGYVAFLRTDEGIDLLRAPLGDLACLFVHQAPRTWIASDIALLKRTGMAPFATDWSMIAQHLAWPYLRGSWTCLEKVMALPSGHMLQSRNARLCMAPLWSPWSFTDHARCLTRDEHVERILRAVTNSVATLAGHWGRPVLLLSGGLDSSILAATLARHDADLLTLYTRDPIGDERAYAAQVAHHIGKPLIEALREVSEIQPLRSAAAGLPWPARRLFEQETMRQVDIAAAAHGAAALMTGGGGDNVFCALQSAAPVADRLLVEGPGPGMLGTAREISALASVPMPTVLRSALARAMPWARRSVARPDHAYLSEEAKARAGANPPAHPWLTPPPRPLPGVAGHIRLLALAQSFSEGRDPAATIPTILPLLAQPVVEACLAVPSWLWFEKGRNRALARRAFAPHLPRAIVERRSKGTPDSFQGEIFEHHHATLRDMLLGGALADQGLIDLSRLTQVFSGPVPMAPPDVGSLLRLVDVEAWLRSAPGRHE
ncbi:asparagine synthetase B family protein [Sphingobium yanoikuyae]|uniref:asparagine synthase-related protein n=1 Tax=Sphingobium yanoikuyae TaxID=13690 RepID=UPI00111319A5|nr:asparagine synthetase B family protein [Sphingobium yanoikuyae]